MISEDQGTIRWGSNCVFLFTLSFIHKMMTCVYFPKFVNVQEKGVKGPSAGGNVSEIFLSKVKVRASLIGGQFF